jgi:hypothetical protein
MNIRTVMFSTLAGCLAPPLVCLAPSLTVQPAAEAPAGSATASVAKLRSTETQPASQRATPTLIRFETETPLPSATSFPEEQLHVVTDETGSISAAVPTLWTDVRSLDWTDAQGRVIGHTLVVSTDADAFLRWGAEGVSISVARDPGAGYLQLLETEYAKYKALCDDPYLTFWDFKSDLYRGRYFVLDDCGGVPDGWLSVLYVVPADGSRSYVARVIGYDLPPLFGDDFRDIIMRFEVDPANLP